jgi:hypothetical protein
LTVDGQRYSNAGTGHWGIRHVELQREAPTARLDLEHARPLAPLAAWPHDLDREAILVDSGPSEADPIALTQRHDHVSAAVGIRVETRLVRKLYPEPLWPPDIWRLNAENDSSLAHGPHQGIAAVRRIERDVSRHIVTMDDLEAISSKLCDHRVGFLHRVDADSKVVERVLNRGCLLGAREKQYNNDQPGVHEATLRGLRENASCKHQRSYRFDPRGLKRVGSGAQGSPRCLNVVDQQDALRRMESPAPKGAAHVAQALAPRQVDLTLRVPHALETMKASFDPERPRDGLREQCRLIEASLPAPSRVERDVDYGVDTADERLGGVGHQSTERWCEVASALVLEPVDRVGDGTSVEEDGAVGGGWFEERLTAEAERRGRGGGARQAGWWAEEVLEASC